METQRDIQPFYLLTLQVNSITYSSGLRYNLYLMYSRFINYIGSLNTILLYFYLVFILNR